MNGGYQVFDLQGANITSAGVTIEGLYKALVERRKPVILENVVIDGEKKGSVFSGVLNENPVEVITSEGVNFTVTTEDIVTKIWFK